MGGKEGAREGKGGERASERGGREGDPRLLGTRVEGKVGLAGLGLMASEGSGGALVLGVGGRCVGDVKEMELREVGLGHEDVFVLCDRVNLVHLRPLGCVDAEERLQARASAPRPGQRWA